MRSWLPWGYSANMPHLGRQRLREKMKREEGRIGVCVHVCLSLYVYKCAVLHADRALVRIQRQETEEERKKTRIVVDFL